MLLLQLLELLLLLLLLLVHEGNGYITGGSCCLEGGVNQWCPDDWAWPRRNCATSSHDAASSCSCGRKRILHGWHAVMFDNLLYQHTVTGTQTSCCKPRTSQTPSTPATTPTHTAP